MQNYSIRLCIHYCAKVLNHPAFLYIFLPSNLTLFQLFKVVLSSSSQGFLKVFQRFLGALPAFPPIFSPVLTKEKNVNFFLHFLRPVTFICLAKDNTQFYRISENWSFSGSIGCSLKPPQKLSQWKDRR